MHVLWINEEASLAGGCERYIHTTAQWLRGRGVRSTLLFDPLTAADPAYLKTFDAAFPLVDLPAQLAELRPDVAYVHQLAQRVPLAALAQSLVPKVRFFHDHRLFCLRNYKYTPIGHHTCTRTVGLGCYPCLGFVNKSKGWPGLRFSLVSRLRAQQRETMFFDAFVVGSQYMAGHVVAHGFDRAKVHVIPPFANPPPALPSVPREPDLLLFVGQLVRGKGLDVLLRALRQVRTPVRLVVVGTGRQGPDYQRLTERLALADRVKFLGRMPPDQLAALYPRATAVVFPSRSPETFGLVGVEAMSHGTPVIASAVGGIGEWLVDGRVGLAVPSGNPEALARAIDRLVADPALVQSMSAEALRRYQERFRPERHVECLQALFGGLMGRNGQWRS